MLPGQAPPQALWQQRQVAEQRNLERQQHIGRSNTEARGEAAPYPLWQQRRAEAQHQGRNHAMAGAGVVRAPWE